MTRRALGAAAIALSLTATAALAQQPGRIRGQIEKVDGDMLMLKTREGAMLNVKVDDKTRVSALVKATLADIKKDSFIGIAGMPQPDNSIQAFSIHIFLPAQRGVVPDRHGPWDAKPGSTMTNAYVEDIVQSKDGDTLMVKYKDGEKKVVVPPNTEVVMFAPATVADIKAGQKFFVPNGKKLEDGTVETPVIVIGSNGVAPPM
jgi:hypothetical protein